MERGLLGYIPVGSSHGVGLIHLWKKYLKSAPGSSLVLPVEPNPAYFENGDTHSFKGLSLYINDALVSAEFRCPLREKLLEQHGEENIPHVLTVVYPLALQQDPIARGVRNQLDDEEEAQMSKIMTEFLEHVQTLLQASFENISVLPKTCFYNRSGTFSVLIFQNPTSDSL